jgi:hypothetical protein
MVTRMEYWSAYEALKDKIEEVGGRIKVIEGKSTGIGTGLGVVTAVAALLISLITPEMAHPPTFPAPR